MRARVLSVVLLVFLASACGARITIRSPIRIRFGRPTAAPMPTLLVVLPFTPTPTPTATTSAATTSATTTPSATPSASATLRPSPSATAERTETATPTATEASVPPTPVEPTATPGTEEPTPTSVATPPPRLPVAAGDYAVRFLQLRFSARGEFVQMANRGPDQDLSGWLLTSAGAGRAFSFPDGYVLRQGETVTVHSGVDDIPSEPGHLLWTGERVWNNPAEEALLHDAGGALVDRWPRS